LHGTEIVAARTDTRAGAALFTRVRRMMLIAGLTTALAVAAVLSPSAIVFSAPREAPVATDTTSMPAEGRPHRRHRRRRRPPGGDAGYRRRTEIRTFDAHRLKPPDGEIRQRP